MGSCRRAVNRCWKTQAAIETAYRDGQIINNAVITVEFDEQGPGISIPSAPFQNGDHLLLHVSDLVGFGVETTTLGVVDEKGTINPPQLGFVKVQGLTEFEAGKKIADAYRAAQIIANAPLYVERISAKESRRAGVRGITSRLGTRNGHPPDADATMLAWRNPKQSS